MEVLNHSEFKVTDEMLANGYKRFANYIIDRIAFYLIIALFFSLVYLVGEFFNNETIEEILFGLEEIHPLLDRLVSSILLATFYMIIEGLTQRSPGKLITRTKVVLENGEKPSAEKFLTRSLCRLIPFEVFSFLGSNARGWHDSISKTYVVNEKIFEEHKLAHENFMKIGS